MDGPPFYDHHRDFSPTDRTSTHQHGTDRQTIHEQTPTTEADTADTVSDQQGHVMKERVEVPGGTEIALLEQVPHPVLPNSSAGTETGLLRTPPLVDPSAVRPLKRFRRNSPTHQRDTSAALLIEIHGGRDHPHSDPRRQRSSSLRTPPVESSSGACSPPKIQRQLRVHRPGWQLMTPYTDPCRPKKPRTRPASSVHAFKPYDLLDPDHVAAYQTYKRNNTGGIHINPYLLILQKRQRAYPTVYAHRVNSWLDIQWERLFGSGVAVPPKEWSMLKHKWHDDDLKTVRGLVPSGNRPWHAVDWVSV
ncbi:hypothetical protein QYF36_024528 [Acer negundo]|nr:hypothetical protein QYF36_024528 [Acer negundo]